jgi:hypothetical protein
MANGKGYGNDKVDEAIFGQVGPCRSCAERGRGVGDCQHGAEGIVDGWEERDIAALALALLDQAGLPVLVQEKVRGIVEAHLGDLPLAPVPR